jgi:AcrR family transcriptional regulator
VARRPRLTRESIVAAAREVVAADGVRGLSLRPLAASLGVTAPALYAHFDSKESLLAAVAEEEFASLITHLEAATTGLSDPIARIKAQCHAYVAYAVAHPALFEVLFVFRPAWARQPAAEELPIASKAFEISAVAVQDAIAAGALRERDALKASLTIWAATHGVATLLLARPGLGAEYEAALVDAVIDSVVAGLSTEGDI